MYSLVSVYHLENEVDGEAFLLITEDQIKTLVPAIGAQMKLIMKRKNILSQDRLRFKVCISFLDM